MEQKIEIFLSYSHRDERFCNELMSHLALLRRQQRVSFWYDNNITPGTNWASEIEKHVHSSRIILLLVSPYYLSSDLLFGKEMSLALERHREGKVRVIPIILRPCIWKNTPIGDFQALPTNGKPVTAWSNPDLAFIDVTRGIRKIIEDMLMNPPEPTQENITELSPISTDEKRLAELENKLQEYRLFILNWETFLRSSSDLEEQAQSRKAIDLQWQTIGEILDEYQNLVKKIGHSIPTEVLQLSNSFNEYQRKDERKRNSNI